MKRSLATALCLGVAVSFGLAGCSDESKVKQSETVSTPDGKTTTTRETKVDSSGSNPPSNTSGGTGAAPAK